MEEQGEAHVNWWLDRSRYNEFHTNILAQWSDQILDLLLMYSLGTWIIQIVQFPCKFFLYQMFISCVKVIQSNWILVSMIKENRETDVTSARLKGIEKLVWFLKMLQNWIWISPWHKKPWHQKGGSQLDSKLSGGPWALKMESGTECTVCAILKMSSDNSSFETGVGILWLMCTWAFQVLYSRAWQTSVATWPDVRDIWMFIWVEWDVYLSRIISIESYKIQPSGDWTKSQISNCSYSVVILSL